MVKNTFGGSSHKKFARSSMAPSANNKAFLRTVREEGEFYAYVNKMYGNGMCNVVDQNAREYMCVIRGKFRGKNKKNNRLEIGTWVLVGLRSWESTTAKKDEKLTCDLLEIYTKEEIERLKATVRGNWKTTCDDIGGGGEDMAGLSDHVVFSSNDDAFEYEAMMKAEAEEGRSSKKISLSTNSVTAQQNDWLCGEEEKGEGEGEVAGGRCNEDYMSRHVNRRVAEYIDFDSI
jgi:translation initiation factor IF-1